MSQTPPSISRTIKVPNSPKKQEIKMYIDENDAKSVKRNLFSDVNVPKKKLRTMNASTSDDIANYTTPAKLSLVMPGAPRKEKRKRSNK
jgi:hypothetical protein